MDKKTLTAKDVEDVISQENLQKVFVCLREIKYGTITLIIQDSKVVQVDKLEKVRFNQL